MDRNFFGTDEGVTLLLNSDIDELKNISESFNLEDCEIEYYQKQFDIKLNCKTNTSVIKIIFDSSNMTIPSNIPNSLDVFLIKRVLSSTNKIKSLIEKNTISSLMNSEDSNYLNMLTLYFSRSLTEIYCDSFNLDYFINLYKFTKWKTEIVNFAIEILKYGCENILFYEFLLNTHLVNKHNQYNFLEKIISNYLFVRKFCPMMDKDVLVNFLNNIDHTSYNNIKGIICDNLSIDFVMFLNNSLFVEILKNNSCSDIEWDNSKENKIFKLKRFSKNMIKNLTQRLLISIENDYFKNVFIKLHFDELLDGYTCQAYLIFSQTDLSNSSTKIFENQKNLPMKIRGDYESKIIENFTKNIKMSNLSDNIKYIILSFLKHHPEEISNIRKINYKKVQVNKFVTDILLYSINCDYEMFVLNMVNKFKPCLTRSFNTLIKNYTKSNCICFSIEQLNTIVQYIKSKNIKGIMKLNFDSQSCQYKHLLNLQ